VHAILNLETDRPVAKNDETLEKRLSQSSASGLLVHDDRTKLLWETVSSIYEGV
jgi:hypothetical protein